MTTQKRAQTKTSRIALIDRKMLQMALFSFVAAFVGFAAALAVMIPTAQQPAAARSLNAQLASTQTTTSCVQPATSKAGSKPGSKPQGGSGGGFVKQLIGGSLHASIQNTGPNSDNKIIVKTITNTHIENTNNVSFVVSNSQTASSGSASVSDNTTAGSANSGHADTNNNPDMDVTISN